MILGLKEDLLLLIKFPKDGKKERLLNLKPLKRLLKQVRLLQWHQNLLRLNQALKK